jgi:hypothetical protein
MIECCICHQLFCPLDDDDCFDVCEDCFEEYIKMDAEIVNVYKKEKV